MSTDKRFAVAGISTQNGATKVRFANDAARVKILIKNGHTDIELIDLPHEMTKAEIAQHMVNTNFAAGRAHVEAAIADLAKKNKVKLTPAVAVAPMTQAEVMATPALV
jgi:hypothetical protein